MKDAGQQQLESESVRRSVFTSNHERWLWLASLTVVVAIYSTLGVARSLFDALRGHQSIQLSFVLMVVLGAVILFPEWVRRRPSRSDFGVAFGVVVAFWMVFVRIENPAERTHLFEYGIVAALIHQAFLERARNGARVPWPAAITVLVTAFIGLFDECIQAVLPSRVFDWNDVFFNALAGFMVIVARLALAPVKRPGWRLWFMWFMASAIGWGVCMDVSLFGKGQRFEFLSFLPSIDVPRYESVAAGGVLVGVFQWLILRRYIRGSAWWVLAGLGAAAAGAIVVFGVGRFDSNLGWGVGAGLYGTLAGVMQWLVLRRKVSQAGWWVLACTVGWVVAFPLGDLGGPPGWAAYGAITGTVLVWLLRQRIPQCQDKGRP